MVGQHQLSMETTTEKVQVKQVVMDWQLLFQNGQHPQHHQRTVLEGWMNGAEATQGNQLEVTRKANPN